MRMLIAELNPGELRDNSPGAMRTAAVQAQLAEDFSGWAHYRQLFDTLLEVLPDARFVGDSTQTVYSGNHLVELDGARRWFNASPATAPWVTACRRRSAPNSPNRTAR